jgi:dihydrofolate reductase
MRKLILQMQMSADGFVAGPNGEMHWMESDWDEEIRNYVSELTLVVDCIVLGRKLAPGFIESWAAGGESTSGENSFNRKMKETRKIVFSKTLKEEDPITFGWENTTIENGDLTKEIKALKQSEGGGIITYGGGDFAAALVKERLVDEFYLFVNPTAIGKGVGIFERLDKHQRLNLLDSRAFHCGIVVIRYAAKP